MDWANFSGPKLNADWAPDDQDLIYTALNWLDGEGDADEDCGQQLVERLLQAWRSALSAPAIEADGWLPIDSAPKDGTRVLIRSVCFQWNSDICQNVAIGHRAVEASFRAGMMGTEQAWREWCGDEKVFSTDWLIVDAWAPLPSPPAHAEGERG